MARHINIKGTKGDDTIIGTATDEHIKARKGNDSVDAGGGDDRIRADSGNDIGIYRLADNTANMDRDNFRGGSGIDTLRFDLTQAEWLGSMALQRDVNDYRAFLNKIHYNHKGEAEGKEFRFDTFDLRAAQFETLQVVVGGHTITSDAQFFGTFAGSVTEDSSLAASTVGGPLVVLDLDAGESNFGTIGALGGIYGNFTFVAGIGTGTWTYTLDNARPVTNALVQDQHVEDKLTVTSADGHTSRDIVVSITGRNDAPVAVNDIGNSTDEDTPLIINVLGNDTDAEGDTLHAVLAVPAAHGTVTSNADGTLRYAPNQDFHGDDSFTYKANDGLANSNEATVTVTVNSVNDAPVAVNDSYIVAPNKTLAIFSPGFLANDTDVDGDPVHFSKFITLPQHGEQFTVGTNGSLFYEPTANFHGTDTLSYAVKDGSLESNVATVTLIVDSAPVANAGPQASLGTVGQPFSRALPAGAFTDPDGDTLTYSAVLAGTGAPLPAWLTIDSTNGTLSGTPVDNNGNGVVSLKIQATDPFGLFATIDAGIILL